MNLDIGLALWYWLKLKKNKISILYRNLFYTKLYKFSNKYDKIWKNINMDVNKIISKIIYYNTLTKCYVIKVETAISKNDIGVRRTVLIYKFIYIMKFYP